MLLYGSDEKQLEDQDYMNFINKYNSKMKIYIATDNRETQDIFRKKYGNRMFVKLMNKKDSELRQTSVQDAVVDIYVCAGARHFMGTPKSSFTELISYIRSGSR